jgi:threonine aldolase
LLEEEIEEKFVKGSGNGGQKINKVKNCVQLTHKPSGIKVSVQDTRSLEQNRKIARKRLYDKVEFSTSPDESKIGKKVAKKQKQKQKARARSKKKYARTPKPVEGESDAGEAGEAVVGAPKTPLSTTGKQRAFSTMAATSTNLPHPPYNAWTSSICCRRLHNFRGDNSTGMHPQILQAIVTANEAPPTIEFSGYGNDPISACLNAQFAHAFGLDGERAESMQVFPTVTGSAANGLAMAAMTAGRPLSAIFCHETAHVYTDELNAASFFCGGVQLVPIPCPAEQHGKLTAADVRAAVRRYAKVMFGGVAVLSLTQSTESGTVYTKHEVEDLSNVAREHGMLVHMDGARIANAVQAQQDAASAGELTWQAGVDCLSFGASKNGTFAADALVVFDTKKVNTEMVRLLMKRAGHDISKPRFMAAQLEAYLQDDLWLKLAAKANTAARELGDGLKQRGWELRYPVEANSVFVCLPEDIRTALDERGFGHFLWDGRPDTVADETRFVCSFCTSATDVRALLSAMDELSAGRE